MADRRIVACIDITGSSRPMDIVWCDDCDLFNDQIGSEEGVVEWAREQRPAVLAIDGPSGRNLGRTRDFDVRERHGWTKKFSRTNGNSMPTYGNMRFCEALLIARGVLAYSTPPDETAADEWIQRGWRLYARLQSELGYALWKKPGVVSVSDRPTLIEVFPHACFVAGLGWIPQNKNLLGGQLERVAYLLEAAKRDGRSMNGTCLPATTMIEQFGGLLAGVNWDSIRISGIRLPKVRHDVLDAIAGLVTAIKAIEGAAFAVGDEEEGVIVLPKAPIEFGTSYRRNN